MNCQNIVYDTPDWLKDFIHLRNAYSHSPDNRYDYFLDQIPRAILDKVCKCHSWQTKKHKIVLDGYLAHCGRCRRLLLHYVTKCVNCRNVFLKDFKHPAFCRWMPYCWECVQMNPDVVCEHSGTYEVLLIPPRLSRIKPRPVYDFGDDPVFTLD